MTGHSEFGRSRPRYRTWRAVRGRPDRPHCLVVVPQHDVQPGLLRNVVGVERYEERMLAMLLQLHARRIHVVFCSARPSPGIVEYYPGASSPVFPMSHSQPRLTMVSCDDLSTIDRKLLERPGCLQRIPMVARSRRARSSMNTTDIERKLAVDSRSRCWAIRRISTTWVEVRQP